MGQIVTRRQGTKKKMFCFQLLPLKSVNVEMHDIEKEFARGGRSHTMQNVFFFSTKCMS